MVDVTSGGPLVNTTLAQARELFNIMAQNTQQFKTRGPQFLKVNELSSGPSVETQLSQITAMLNKLVTGGIQKVVVCGICCLEGHNHGQRKYDPYFNTYNEGWRDHPSLRYGPRNNPTGFDQPSRKPSAQDRTNFLLEQVIKKMDDQKKDIDNRFQDIKMTLKQVQER